MAKLTDKALRTITRDINKDQLPLEYFGYVLILCHMGGVKNIEGIGSSWAIGTNHAMRPSPKQEDYYECKECGVLKHRNEYWKHTASPSGRRKVCAECIKAKRRIERASQPKTVKKESVFDFSYWKTKGSKVAPTPPETISTTAETS